MTPISRFSNYLNQAKVLLAKAKEETNPALWLYANDFRTPLFRLQGLARVYRKMHNKKVFEKINAKTKQLEDAFGKLDYYAAFAKQLQTEKVKPISIVNYCKEQAKIAEKELEKILQEEKWLNGKRIEKIEKKLYAAKWLDAEKEQEALKAFFQKEVEKIQEFVKETGTFDNVEEDVHELRRKLRWISIYAFALNGGVQLEKNARTVASIKKYLTPNIINSPFNKLPSAPEGIVPVLFNQNEFFTLSFIIAELGKLKDEGLKLLVVQEALQHKQKLNEKAALAQAKQILGKKQKSIAVLLKQATVISDEFFKTGALAKLVKA